MSSHIRERALKECELRMAVTPESATVRGLIFNAVLALVGRSHGDAAAEALRETVSKKAYVDFFSYPARDFLRLLYAAAERLTPQHDGSLEAAIRACGGAAVSGFFQSGAAGGVPSGTAGGGAPGRGRHGPRRGPRRQPQRGRVHHLLAVTAAPMNRDSLLGWDRLFMPSMAARGSEARRV